MARSQSLRNAISAVILLLVLLATATTFKKPAMSLLWRKIRHYPTALVAPYRAPMVGCDWGDAIPGGYGVFVHYGYSLEDHKQHIGNRTDLDSKIRHISANGQRYGVIYWAYDVDPVALDAIRADIVVDGVECDRAGEMVLDGIDHGEIGVVGDVKNAEL